MHVDLTLTSCFLGNLDVVFLARTQFALTIMFHYLFPPLTIGMGVVLVYLEGRFLWTKDPIYETAARFWTQLFAVNFALGVATGIVMEFEFGTNWAVYSRFVGDVFGSALAAVAANELGRGGSSAVGGPPQGGIALWPNLVTARNNPQWSLTVWRSASSRGTLGIMLAIALIGMPLVLTYTCVVYWTFRRRVEIGKHSY